MLLLCPEKQPQLIPTGQAPSQPKPQAVNMLIRVQWPDSQSPIS